MRQCGVDGWQICGVPAPAHALEAMASGTIVPRQRYSAWVAKAKAHIWSALTIVPARVR